MVEKFKAFNPSAHPRVSGENFLSLVLVMLSDGSSPRERGKHIDPGVYQAAARLIPA